MEYVYVFIGIVSLITIANLITDYLNYKSTKILTQRVQDLSNRLDAMDVKVCQRMKEKDVYAMWDIHNARVASYCEDLKRESTNIHRLLPLLPLADKFDIKRKLKHNKAYADDLKFDLKEIEHELKELA